MSTSKADVVRHAETGAWRSLVEVALKIVADAERAAGVSMHPLLGGGTRLMLSLHHRISDDIDLFIRDPQWIGYLTPRLNPKTDELTNSYEENAVSLKLRLATGEIDFIVAMSLLNLPAQKMPDIAFELEPIGEVLAKKLFYRGSLLSPRDLFDWWAIAAAAPAELLRQQLGKLLANRYEGIELALQTMRESQAAQRIWASLRAPDIPSLSDAVDFGLEEIAAFRSIDAS